MGGAVGRTFTNVGLPFPLLDSQLGASLPSFAAAFVLSLGWSPKRGTSPSARRSSKAEPRGQSFLP